MTEAKAVAAFMNRRVNYPGKGLPLNVSDAETLRDFHALNRHQPYTTSIMNISAAASSAQEALETAAQTRAEAAKGDQQGMRRVARMATPQAQQATMPAAAAPAAAAPAAPEAAPSVPPDSTGVVLNVKA